MQVISKLIIGQDSTVRFAFALMLESQVNYLLVFDVQGRLIGVLFRRDPDTRLVTHFIRPDFVSWLAAAGIMT